LLAHTRECLAGSYLLRLHTNTTTDKENYP